MSTSQIAMEQMKTHMIAMASLKGDSGSKKMSQLVYSIIAITIVDKTFAVLPHIWKFSVKHIKQYLEKKREEMQPKILGLTKKDIKGEILLSYDESPNSKTDNSMVEALLDQVSSLPQAKRLRLKTRFVVESTEPIEIANEVFFQVTSFEASPNEESMVKMKVFSYEKTVVELRKWLEDVRTNHENEKECRLNGKRFIFEENVVMAPKDTDGTYRLDSLPPVLSFHMNQFQTNRHLYNVYGSEVKTAYKRIKLFLEKPSWYEKRGIPLTFGVLLHGPPGTGKTSFIKAIANDTDRHIISINLSECTTKKQLRNLFFTDRLTSINNGQAVAYKIPQSKRIYVFEDVDCLSDVVLDRGTQDPYSPEHSETSDDNSHDLDELEQEDSSQQLLNSPYRPSLLLNQDDDGSACYSKSLGTSEFDTVSSRREQHSFQEDKKDNTPPPVHPEKITLSFLLNLLDGVVETPGRIIIMTSNYPERLDKALIRPGRIDLILRFGYCTLDVINEMFQSFYEEKNIRFCGRVKHKITPAKLNQIMFEHCFEPQNAAHQVVVKTGVSLISS
jgi:DNA polymerase III delta prime subunit